MLYLVASTSPLSFQIVPFQHWKLRSEAHLMDIYLETLHSDDAGLLWPGHQRVWTEWRHFFGRKKKTGDVHDALFSLPRWDDARSNDADGRREDFKLGINMLKFCRWRSCVTQSALNLKIVCRMRHDGLWLWRFGSLVWNHTAQFQRFCLLPQSFKPIPRDIEEAYYSLLESRLQSWR